ncbi:hypothetical protein MS3_00003413 [Schistosoma haematobium]|uniref:Uncharacterized protein n=1 Tax=Schistosoma haematobium TaxID=6185 RepID=A0A095B023_SCHHA|nr:hypothetical protein MS3_00003413 [Schistosoma haematobium]KAH9590934.1 hypothetical protein MS3_00003413 [Schistosoma haematobium]CAH8663816.1 unnamed protein product [Schistosoma haematobium]
MKSAFQFTKTNTGSSHLENPMSAEKLHTCGVIYETKISRENSNPLTEKSKNDFETTSGKHQQNVPKSLGFKHESKNLLMTNRIDEGIMKQKLPSNVGQQNNPHSEKDVNSCENVMDNNKILKQKSKRNVSYHENVDTRSVDNSSNAGSKNYYSSSSSTMSSVTESSTSQNYTDSVSPEAHLSKLKKIHRKASRRKKLKYLKGIFCFLSVRIILLFTLILSILFLLVGYLLHIRNILITGCILSLTSVGCLVQLCFTKRTSSNKFNPQSVPFALAAEDLPNTENKTLIPSLTIATSNQLKTTSTSTVVNEIVVSSTNNDGNLLKVPEESSAVQLTTSPNTPVVIGIDHIQARRLSMALQHLSRNSFQPQTLSSHKHETTSMLNMARRLTMASSAIALGSADRDYYGHSSWLTGSRVRHGVRRSLAWNESGATRFYEHCYD